MTSRERVLSTLNHEEPDRIPIDFGATSVTGMHISVVDGLRKRLGLDPHPVKVIEPMQMLGEIEPDLQDALGLDVAGFSKPTTMFGFRNENWKPWRTPQGLDVLVAGNFNTTVDEDGSILIYPEGDLTVPPSAKMPKDGYFFDSISRQQPLDEDALHVEDNLEEFKPLPDELLEELKGRVKAAGSTGRAVVAAIGGTAFGDIALVPAPFLKRPKGIRDVTEWYVSTRSRRDYIHGIYSAQLEIALANLERVYTAIPEGIDVLFICGTDFGTQTSSFCSVDTFRELWLPYYQKLNAWVHEHTPWKTFKHSCGSVEKFIPSFIEAGFDILNPVQCSAAHMEPEHLKRTYGSRLTFWGGGVDTQHTLPFGSPADVQQQVAERCRIFSPGGGFVFNTIHNIQANTPVENVLAMFETVRAFSEQNKGAVHAGTL